ncbi:hypothetical protein GGU11DRAFT_799162, partial [Lentinula aff. detonsa]
MVVRTIKAPWFLIFPSYTGVCFCFCDLKGGLDTLVRWIHRLLRPSNQKIEATIRDIRRVIFRSSFESFRYIVKALFQERRRIRGRHWIAETL